MTLKDHARCSQEALRLVADYWVLRIVEELSLTAEGLRFSELQRLLGGASPATLSNRLRRLEQSSLVSRDGATGRLSVVYSLSDRGRRILPVINAIDEFATGRRQSETVPST
jgi:DNA-binding HxlR family transcriptional regulator